MKSLAVEMLNLILNFEKNSNKPLPSDMQEMKVELQSFLNVTK